MIIALRYFHPAEETDSQSHSHSLFLPCKCKLSSYCMSVNRLHTTNTDKQTLYLQETWVEWKRDGVLISSHCDHKLLQFWWLKKNPKNKNTNLFSHSSEDQMSEIKVWARPHPIEVLGKKEPLPGPGGCWHSLAYSHLTPIFVFISVDLLLCVSNLPLPFFDKNT